MKLFRVRSYDDYVDHRERVAPLLERHREFLAQNTPAEKVEFTVPGYSYTAQKQVNFVVDYQHALGDGLINWRERVCCPETHHNNRMRAAFQLFDIEMAPYPDIYLCVIGQAGPVYKHFASRYEYTIGCDYFGGAAPRGQPDSSGIRFEDADNLSFLDGTFDAIVSLDVFQYLPQPERAFRECARILKPGGKMMFSSQFNCDARRNVTFADVQDGEIRHIHTPVYHDYPLSSEGVLFCQDFGWEVLDQMRMAGFSDAYAICYQSAEMGYLGDEQFLFFAVK